MYLYSDTVTPMFEMFKIQKAREEFERQDRKFTNAQDKAFFDRPFPRNMLEATMLTEIWWRDFLTEKERQNIKDEFYGFQNQN